MRAQAPSIPSDNVRCRYRGKPCANLRALRIDGTPHHLCDEHRRRANRNQRRSQLRIRLRKQLKELREKSLEASPFQVLWNSMAKEQACATLTDQQLFRIICTADMDPPMVLMGVSLAAIEEEEQRAVDFLSPLMLDASSANWDHHVKQTANEFATVEDVWAELSTDSPF